MNAFDFLSSACSMFSGGGDLSSWYGQVCAQQNAQMQQVSNGIVASNMNNPQVQMAYQQHLAQGGQYSFEQYCYAYAATGGFSQQGMANYQQVEMGIANQQQQAMAGYHNAQAQSAAAMQDWRNGYAANQQEAGNVMQGNQTYNTPYAGTQALPYGWQPGYHTYNNQQYYVDQSHNYYQQQQPNSGYYQQVTPYGGHGNGY